MDSKCEHCLKPISSNRITLKSLFSDLISVLFNLEKGFLYTIKQLTIQPWNVIKEYIKGDDRLKYYNPFRYAFIMITISLLLYMNLGLYDSNINVTSDASGNLSQSSLEETIKEYNNLISLLFVPFLSIGTLLFFKTYNYAEHLVANFFMFGHISFYGLFVLPIVLLFPAIQAFQSTISIGIIVVVQSITFKKLYNQTWWLTLLKVLGALIVGMLCTFITSIVLFGLVKLVTELF